MIAHHAPETLPHEKQMCGRCPRCHPGRQWGGDERCTLPDCRCHPEGNPMADHVPAGVLRLLTARDGHECIWTGTESERLVPQHRQGGMGGRRGKHQLANLLWFDSILNGEITSDPTLQAIARAYGFAISLHADPEQIPVYRPHMHQWFRLHGDTRTAISSLEALDLMHGFYGDDYFVWKAVADRSPQAGILRLRGGR